MTTNQRCRHCGGSLIITRDLDANSVECLSCSRKVGTVTLGHAEIPRTRPIMNPERFPRLP